MATISFYAGSTAINNLSGSGLGFFGGSFGQSVELNQFQSTTFITDGNGSVNGGTANNVKYSTDTTGFSAGIVPATGLKYIPNSKASCNIRFTNSTTVKTQNVRLRIFDRNNKSFPASGVITRVAELLNPRLTYGTVEGSGDATWWGSSTHTGADSQGTFQGSPLPSTRLPAGTNTVGGSGIIVPLAQSPGPSGFYAGNGSANTGQYTQHDWYVGITASPDSVGSKTQYGLYVELEYL
jgi:hypothetical protein